MGEIGISRREFLYELRFWEVDCIIKGYRSRNRLTHQLLAEIVYTTMYINRDHKGKTVEGMFPMLFEEEEDDDEPIMTKEDSDELQQLMVDMNAQQNPDK